MNPFSSSPSCRRTPSSFAPSVLRRSEAGVRRRSKKEESFSPSDSCLPLLLLPKEESRSPKGGVRRREAQGFLNHCYYSYFNNIIIKRLFVYCCFSFFPSFLPPVAVVSFGSRLLRQSEGEKGREGGLPPLLRLLRRRRSPSAKGWRRTRRRF